MDRNSHFFRDPIDLFHISIVLSCDTPVQLDIHVPLSQQAHGLHCLVETARIMAQRFIGPVICSIKSDIDPAGFVFSKKISPLFA